ncbi:MAG: glycosyltransferase [Chitinophagaceae bacterium]|nr:MAG: glycosyltransferase [Chitinophagaceae bacterium]
MNHAGPSSIGSPGSWKTLVVIPTYNEAENIERISQEIISSQPDVSILFVDDHSPDGTGEIADRLARETPRISVIHRLKKTGLGSAYVEGFRYALAKNYDFVLSMDCDLSHDPRDIPRLVHAALNGVDLVISSRYIKGGRIVGWPIHRYLLSRLANFPSLPI